MIPILHVGVENIKAVHNVHGMLQAAYHQRVLFAVNPLYATSGCQWFQKLVLITAEITITTLHHKATSFRHTTH